MAVSGLASAGLLLPGRLWAAPQGSRKPAPATAASDPKAAAIIAASTIVKDEPLAQLALDTATKSGASYADCRLVLWKRERVSVRDDHIAGTDFSDEYGLGIRVIAEGAWGFAATSRLDKKSIVRIAKQAVAIAKRNAMLMPQPVELAPTPAIQGTWVSPFEIDPFTVPLQDKASYLIDAAQTCLKVPGVRHIRAQSLAVREEKLLLTSEGSRIHQVFLRVMPGFSATAVDRRRGRFTSRDHEVQPMLAGWEHATAADFIGAAREIGTQAVQKLHAKSVEPGKRTVVLAPTNLWLTIHESIGHPTELDRARGLEANYAGTSFLKPEMTGRFRIGSDIVQLVADRTQTGGLATTGWDDEAVPAGKWPIVKDGMLVGWQTTRDQASWIGEKRSRGCSYADSYASVPFQRMPNISLQPGSEGYTTEDLIAATDDGILITGRGSWSIDHQRYNFQFGGQFFWEIKNGRLTRPLRDVAYQSNTAEFWQSCDMLGGEGTYRLGGSFSDGKGEPPQSNAVSHGCPPARFTVNILNTGGDR